ncbi:hypothetical protein LUZ60_003082 [Juncus effusus]|nr:hypothetical protein LUZ60_003082 [Juncus effusus]
MSSNWRSLQHRHKYTYTSVIFPKSFTESLNQIPSETFNSFNFFTELKNFTSLNSTYSQLSEAKKLATAFANLLSTPQKISEELIFTCARFYLEILFLENSLPLHRTLISVLNKCQKFHHVISNCFAELCKEYTNSSGKEKRGFLVSRATLSLIGYPKLGILDETVQNCSDLVALDVVSGLERILLEVSSGSRPSPVVMEQCQEAMSCMYYLLQRYPSNFTGSENNLNILKSVFSTILSVLKSNAFSRDCLVASGVSFCAAIQALMGPTELSSFISSELFQFFSDENSEKGLHYSDLVLEIKTPSILSRLCLLRGILTAIPREVLNTRMINSVNKSTWTILYNGILPELCTYCENPTDSHFNFHALTVTQICLQQIKTSILSKITDFSDNYSPFSEEIISRVLKIIWKNLEDPLSQTVKQVHLIFDLLLDIQSSVPSNNNSKTKLFLSQIALDLLALGPRCKGRYVPLASLTKRLGANSILNLNSNLILETVYSYRDDDVCCAVTSFLKTFLETLRDECWAEFGIEKGYNEFRVLALKPLMQGLVSGQTKLRTNLSTYAISTILDVDTDSIFTMLEFISIGPDSELPKNSGSDLKLDQCITALVSLIKVSRNMALIEGDIESASDNYAIILIKGVKMRIPAEWFVMALTHSDESVRIDVGEALFLNPKTASLPSDFELSLIRKAVPLNMRCSSTAFQMKWTSLFRKFFSRVRTSLERQVKLGSWVPNTDSTNKAESLYQFMNWLSRFLFYSCYPSAPYERKTMAMELILIMLDTWPINQNSQNTLHPYPKTLTSPDSTISLVGSIVDSWDKLRENAFRILFCFPTPLPGISENDVIDDIIKWAKKLVHSPRVRESDAGALTMRLIFKKYVLGFGSILEFSSEEDRLRCEVPEGSGKGNPVISYVSALADWLESVVEEAERDLTESCRKSFVHGILLTMRYTFEELDWGSETVQLSGTEMRGVLGRLLGLIVRITALALWVVSADVWSMPFDMDDDEGEEGFGEELVPELEESGTKREGNGNGKPAEHVVMVGCWLAMKEVSLLFGTIIRKVPLPSSTNSNPTGTEILDLVQLETMGDHFLQVLLKMKHNGAIDKTRAGFTALCNRLLCSNDSRLCKMTESWMELLITRTVSKGQTVDDLLRRSAGIPAAFMALFLSEPDGAPKKLLPKALSRLLQITKIPLSIPPNPQPTPNSSNSNDISKIRDEGVVPAVHAFNSMRAAFNDANLAADTSGFCAEAIIVCIKSFLSPYWEVRNAATLAYTALLRRMVGFLNVQKRESARRSLTGLEFFHRYPALHPFLLTELNTATESLSSNGSTRHAESNIAKAIHPSICPILILLSRLKPSPISSGSDETLDPFTLLPFIQKCATQNNLKIRVLASRALTGLVSNEKLGQVITEIAIKLPQCENLVPFNAIHGLLLQLNALLDGNCKQLTDSLQKDQIMRDLIRVLSNCSWLGSVKKCNCPIVSTLYLRVLDLMLDISRTGDGTSGLETTIKSLLYDLSSKCLDIKISEELEIMHDPTKIELREQAAISYFNSFSLRNNESSHENFELDGINERILSCVTDFTYEVRVSTMKRLVKIVSAFKRDERSIFYSWAKTGLQLMLMDRLFAEQNPKCVYYILKIIFCWNTQFNEHFEGSIFSFWERLVQLNGTTLRAKTKEIIIRCMSICMKSFVKSLKLEKREEMEVSSGNIDSFVNLVKDYSDPSRPVNMRKAACEAIIACNLLQEADFVSKNWEKLENSNLGNLILDLWFVTVQLLEDEDASIRQKLANYVQKIISEKLDNNKNNLCDDFVPTQVDRVIEMSFDFLSAQFGNSVQYLNYLAQKVFDTSFYASSRGDLVRQIFDKEIDNHHEEKMLICQICCSNLEKLIEYNNNSNEIQLFVRNWRAKFLNELVLFMGNSEFRNDWIGGIGNHKDAFIAVYANLLGIFALSKFDLVEQFGDINGVCLDLSELKEIIGPFIRNPLISNLYLLVIKEQEECSDLNGFDPYFLL